MTLDDLVQMDGMSVISWLEENYYKYDLILKPIKIESLNDIHIVGQDILVWTGIEWKIDYVIACLNPEARCMAKNSKVLAYLPMPNPLTDVS